MYFSLHPKTIYNNKEIVNIFTRVILNFTNIVNENAYEIYDIKDNESPEALAYKLYGDSELHWVLLIINNIVDVNKDWAMSNEDFNNYVDLKYPIKEFNSIDHGYDALDEIYIDHHYEDEDGDIVDKPVLDWESMVFFDVILESGNNTLVNDILLLENDTGNLINEEYDESVVDVVDRSINSISNYEYEEKINNEKQRIRIIKPEYINIFVEEFKSLL
jgi:hypothetical protein